MQYEELTELILNYPADSMLYPLDSHWWIHIPNHAMTDNKSVLDYLPNDFVFNKAVSLGLLNYCNSQYSPVDKDMPNVLDHLNIGLLNGYTQEYIIFGSTISILVDGNLYQFTRD